MSGNLIFPRCEVHWGKVNLTCYSGGGPMANEPIVFAVEVHLESSNNGPTASMSWNPAAEAFKIYESFLSSAEKMKETITIRYFYVNGKSISFRFVWSGQRISYGNNMTVTVSMTSELAGEVNANVRSTAQAPEKPVPFLDASKKLAEQHGQKPEVLAFTQQALVDNQKATLNTNYNSNATFGSSVAELQRQNGNGTMASNIGNTAKVVVYTPYSTEKDAPVDGSTIPPQTDPDPAKRYGYFLGPSIINSIERSMEYKPPQQTNTNVPTTAAKPTPSVAVQRQLTSQQPPSAPSAKAQENSQKATTSPIAPSSGATSPTVNSANNPEGPTKQYAMEQENSAQLTASMFMAPVICGIKPLDVVFVPSFTGDYIEDWVVQSVDYNQTDGGVDISINATRQYGQGNPMNSAGGKKFLALAKQKKLVGPEATLEAWEAYAWPTTLKGASQPTPAQSSAASAA